MRQCLSKGLLFTALICSFSSCSVRNENFQSDFNRLIVTSFNQYNQHALSSYDSCFVVNSIENDVRDMGGGLMRTLYGVEILSYSVPSTDFSFAMVRRKNEAEWTFLVLLKNIC